jgi:hypothetical protein
MSEREEHFNLGSGWPLAKDEVGPRITWPFIVRPPSRAVYRIAFDLATVATMIGGLCYFWCWRLSLSDDPLTAGLGLGKIETSKIQTGMFALAEVKRREGWSGKVIDANPEEGGYNYDTLVERQAARHDTHPGARELRKMVVNSTTGRVWDYGKADLGDLPERLR